MILILRFFVGWAPGFQTPPAGFQAPPVVS